MLNQRPTFCQRNAHSQRKSWHNHFSLPKNQQNCTFLNIFRLALRSLYCHFINQLHDIYIQIQPFIRYSMHWLIAKCMDHMLNIVKCIWSYMI